MSSKLNNELVSNQGFTIVRIHGCSHNTFSKTKEIIHNCLTEPSEIFSLGNKGKNPIHRKQRDAKFLNQFPRTFENRMRPWVRHNLWPTMQY